MKKLYIIILSLFFTAGVFAQIPRTVIVEHFTNSRCGICASKNPAFYSLLNGYPQVLHLAIHPSAPYSTCIFSQHNPVENDARTNFYNVYGATPRVVIQGEVIPPASQLMTAAQIESRLGKMSDYELSFTHTYTNSDSIKAHIVVKKISGSAEDGLNLYAVLAEELIEYNAPNGENMHHDVFRKVIVNEMISLAQVGDSITRMVTYLPHPDWNQEEIYTIALVQKEEDKSILQAGRSGFAEEVTGIDSKEIEAPENVFYPNPVEERLNIRSEYREIIDHAAVYNLFGKLVLETGSPDQINVSALSKGYYFLVLTGKDNSTYTTKFVKR